MKWLVRAAIWHGIRIAVAAMRPFGITSLKVIGRCAVLLPLARGVKHIAGNATPEALSWQKRILRSAWQHLLRFTEHQHRGHDVLCICTRHDDQQAPSYRLVASNSQGSPDSTRQRSQSRAIRPSSHCLLHSCNRYSILLKKLLPPSCGS